MIGNEETNNRHWFILVMAVRHQTFTQTNAVNLYLMRSMINIAVG